jgi:hypothetical protein
MCAGRAASERQVVAVVIAASAVDGDAVVAQRAA